MYFYKAFGLNIHSEISLPELSIGTEENVADLTIKIGSVKLPRLAKTPIYRRGIRAKFGKGAGDSLILHWEEVADFESIGTDLLIVAPQTQDPNILSLFTVSEALGLVLFQRGHFLLHASAVKVGNEAWVFMGNPGAGKSTTAAAFIKAGCALLSDDLTAITFDSDGIPYIVPAYPQLKIWDNTVNGLQYDKRDLQPVSEGVNKFSYQPSKDFDHQPVRLNSVYFIHKAKNKAVLKALAPGEIPIEMLKNFPLPVELLKDESLKQHFTQSFRCAVHAQIWKKRRPDGFANLENWVQQSLVSVTSPA
ncbi:serine kinase [Dyadobacter sp. CY312]|uniref:serine kinase n=1 Tax=Dyadobacter sp. CY312 TaxID=2907303 RepID=UPI001F20974E|nr:serine kinase [Dyadobacter sp. CY312]MCE7039819.1 serine kinase [Dyadobacter sp. CY312]